MGGGSSGGRREGASTELDEAARRSFALGRVAWPQIGLEYEAFKAYFVTHTKAVASRDTHAADMFLACACAQGDARAMRVFEDTLAADMARAAASIDPSSAFVEEVVQATRERLFVPKGQEPGKIASYAGRSSLKRWLCAVAVRAAISVRRRRGEKRYLHVTSEYDLRLASGGPELEFLRRRYKDVFEDALRDALQRTPAKQRMLLRLHWADRMSIDRLAKVYNVGRSTVARWLATAHKLLLEEVRRELHEKLHVTSTELDGLATEMRSQLEISLLKLLGSSQGG